MAKVLVDIDKIRTTTGTEVDLENIQASAGGSVSADGLALSRSEDATAIRYAFNVAGAANTHEADGHSSSADAVMFGGGGDTSVLNTCDMTQFSSSSNAVDHGDLSVARTSLMAGSDGTQVMFAGVALQLKQICVI